jgi:hypothetical protein
MVSGPALCFCLVVIGLLTGFKFLIILMHVVNIVSILTEVRYGWISFHIVTFGGRLPLVFVGSTHFQVFKNIYLLN